MESNYLIIYIERKLNYVNFCVCVYIYSVINIFFHPPNYYSKLMKHVCFPGKFLLEICSGVVCGG